MTRRGHAVDMVKDILFFLSKTKVILNLSSFLHSLRSFDFFFFASLRKSASALSVDAGEGENVNVDANVCQCKCMRMRETPCIITPCMQCRRVTYDPRDSLRGDIKPSWNLCRINVMTR